MLTLGQKLKFKETCQNPLYISFTVVLCKKELKKRPNIREMRPFLKSAIIQSLEPIKNPHLGAKIKIAKHMSKFILEIIYNCSGQKIARKKTKYSKNETILKISLHAKLKFQKTCHNSFYKSFTIVLCKKPQEKRPNIREMRQL